eukprot:NODE_6672_length_827_cov_98.654830_g6436_i0.p1 GENE.NODE_6672_length_827_cov_98.654830_g6436_i0~~NODE_6672_length_827_cov_98.654830_g6436_i0.p1  ORF type:complete len:196 (-),score=37.45 NODE_6672_length_827_cov_98.654830_g6436_i0:238-753(-)
MQQNNITFATSQTGLPSLEWDNSISDASWKYAVQHLNNVTSEAWTRAQTYYTRYHKMAWDRFVYAGCMEIAKVSAWQTDRYYDYLRRSDWLEGAYFRGWLEQAFKTIWVQMTVPLPEWKYMCEMVIQHKNNPTGVPCDSANAAKSAPPLWRLLSGKHATVVQTKTLSAWQH